MKRALAHQSKTIRLPADRVDKISGIRRAAMKPAEESGREPTDEEVAMELNIPVNKVAHLKTVSIRPTPLDAPIGELPSSGSAFQGLEAIIHGVFATLRQSGGGPRFHPPAHGPVDPGPASFPPVLLLTEAPRLLRERVTLDRVTAARLLPFLDLVASLGA